MVREEVKETSQGTARMKGTAPGSFACCAQKSDRVCLQSDSPICIHIVLLPLAVPCIQDVLTAGGKKGPRTTLASLQPSAVSRQPLMHSLPTCLQLDLTLKTGRGRKNIATERAPTTHFAACKAAHSLVVAAVAFSLR